MRSFLGVAIALLVLSSLSATASEPTSECAVSVANALLTGRDGPSDRLWFGSESLAVAIPENGIWHGMGPERDFFDKLFWLVGGFQPGLESDFSLTGRHLYDDLIKPIIDDAGNASHEDFGGWSILVGVGFPRTGCWELTGTYLGQSLTFVVNVR